MKKKIFAALMAGVMIFSLTACGKDGKNENSTENESIVYYEIGGTNHKELTDYSEYVTLGDYTGLKVEVQKSEDINIQVKDYISQILENNSTYAHVTDRVVGEDDTINLDYSGKYNGVAFEKGTATGYTYKIHGGFIDDLDKQLVGLECGKEYDLNCTFPKDYKNDASLAGKEVVFTVKVNYIQGEKIVPEWTDDFVKTLTSGTYQTTAAFEEELAIEIKEDNEANQESVYTSGIWEAIINNADIKKYPEEKVKTAKEDYLKEMKAECENAASQYGIEYEDILKLYGFENEEKLEEYCQERAEKELEYIMAASLIAQKENIAVTDKIYDAFIGNITENMTFADASSVEEKYGEDYIMESFIFQAVSEWLKERCEMVLVDKVEETTPDSTKEETTTEVTTKEETTTEDTTKAE